jgi:hypothetical protein
VGQIGQAVDSALKEDGLRQQRTLPGARPLTAVLVGAKQVDPGWQELGQPGKILAAGRAELGEARPHRHVR